MFGYLELVAKPHRPFHFELAQFLIDPDSALLTSIWSVRLPSGIKEEQRWHLVGRRTVLPPHRKVGPNTGFIAAASPEARSKIIASAERSVPECHFGYDLRASVPQIRVGKTHAWRDSSDAETH